MGKEQKVSTLFKPSRCIWAVIISIIVLSLNYFICNTSFPLPDEMKIMRNWDIIKEFCGERKGYFPDDISLINVAYDKELIVFKDKEIKDKEIKDKEIRDDTLGETAITNRRKLLEFLNIAKEANNYKYIFLDVNFEEGYISESDSALFKTIIEMDRIVIPRHEGQKLQDDRLYAKAAISDYTVTREENNFSRFQFIHNGMESVPLKMYEDIYNKGIHKFGPLYFSNNWLCRNGITLKLPFTISEDYTQKNIILPNLGENTLKYGSVADDIEGKIVIIGDFENDMHDTYIGKQPGAIIILNAFHALVQGDHILLGEHGLTLLFYIFTAFLYFFLAVMYLNGKSLSSLFENPWIKVFVSILSINLLFLIIASIAYLSPLDIVYNVWIPTVVFSILDFIVNTYNNYRNEKNKNRTNNANAATDGTKCN